MEDKEKTPSLNEDDTPKNEETAEVDSEKREAAEKPWIEGGSDASSDGDFLDTAALDAPDIAVEEKDPKREKRSRSVPLRAYVASLLAVVLVLGMFTVAIASATRRLGYLEGIAELAGQGGSDGSGELVDFSELEFLDRFFKTYSYNDLSDAEFLSAVLKAYVAASGDLYAEYYTPEEYEEMMSERSGESVGVGISVIQTTVTIGGVSYTAMEIVAAFPDSPAVESGVMPGDLIVYVGSGEERALIESIGYTEALNRMRGEKGTLAEFTVLRPSTDGGYEEIPFSIPRREYTMQSVEYKISETDPTVGIVRILQFDLTTPEQFEKAMDALIESGIERFVFDVRNNPGGDLKSICAVLSFFLEEGDLIISTVDRDGNREETFVETVSYTGDYKGCSVKKSDIGKYRDYEMAVLTNGNTASAAELFTAALRDYDLATIVGDTTYGKGSMQTMYSLTYWGYEGAVKLTTRHYFPPSGEGYDGIGIVPDVSVSLSEEASKTNIYKLEESDDAQLQSALGELKGSVGA